MRRFLLRLTPFLLACPGGAASAQDPFTFTVARYTCDGGQKVEMRYGRYGVSGPRFAMLTYSAGSYALAEANSADGDRFAGLFGPTVNDEGLEWWERGGVATLSKFTSPDTSETRAVLKNCRTR